MNVFPVTASTISAKELGEFAQEKYGLDNSYACKLFRTGMNHTYFISNDISKYVLRVYSHNWRTKSEITEELKLLNLLRENNLSISYPIKDINGELIQEINAPEGKRYMVVFSFAKGEKVRFMNNETCSQIGALMAQIHTLVTDKNIDRISYNKKTLLEKPYEYLQQFFSENLSEMKYIKEFGETFKNSDFKNIPNEVVHMDIWYDNMAITEEKELPFSTLTFVVMDGKY
ncbi:phosphotransferase [Maribacter spongiicola]|uniref:phosphotransferase n=1 Tax=Maribacter spongiicola TaxID=1206753 RepID=UPI001FBC09DA|nr:phosphotransferase [Maribacter spongiicola]